MRKNKILTVLLLALVTSCHHVRQDSTAPAATSSDEQTVLTGDEGKQVSDRTVAEVKREIGSAGPMLSFRLVQEYAFSNWHYRIEIRNKAGALIQTLKIRNGIPIQEGDLVLQDLNADGFLDLRVPGGTDKSGQKWHKSWRYVEETRRYMWTTE
jgi:hypothetical protein